jgi:hypothetical protein
LIRQRLWPKEFPVEPVLDLCAKFEVWNIFYEDERDVDEGIMEMYERLGWRGEGLLQDESASA